MFLSKFKLKRSKSQKDICLSEQSISALQNIAKNSRVSFEETSNISSENMAGDLQSRVRGAGVDFEENKPYQIGSDSRYINWRTFARTQELFVNVYNEDKRPSTYILIDQRANMYFGTRKQLKIKQALNIAIHSIFKAMHQQQNVSGVQVLSKPIWHKIYSGQNAIASFVSLINIAKIPNFEPYSEPSLNSILNKVQLNEGSELTIISDFHDISSETITRLYALSQKYKVNLIQVQDPIEVALPARGHYRIMGSTNSSLVHLNCNKELSNNYRHTVQDKFEEYKEKFAMMGIHFSEVLTTDDLFQGLK